MTFSRYLLRLLWHWSFPLLLGAFFGYAASAFQVMGMAHLVEEAFAASVQACVDAGAPR